MQAKNDGPYSFLQHRFDYFDDEMSTSVSDQGISILTNVIFKLKVYISIYLIYVLC